MPYYYSKTLAVGFDEAVERTIESLKAQGFGIVTDIDIKAIFKKKMGVDFRPYRILGACNPKLALEALTLEDKIGTMLPCNVVVRDAGDGETEIAAIDPVASMRAVENPALKRAAERVRVLLQDAVASL